MKQSILTLLILITSISCGPRDKEKENNEFENDEEREPVTAENYLGRGIGRFHVDEFKEAIKDFTIAIEMDTATQLPAYHYRAAAKFHLKDYRGACDDYDNIIKIYPSDAEAYYARGHLKFLDLNEKESGAADINKSLEMDSALSWQGRFDYRVHLKKGYIY